jgi:hypothetical protein
MILIFTCCIKCIVFICKQKYELICAVILMGVVSHIMFVDLKSRERFINRNKWNGKVHFVTPQRILFHTNPYRNIILDIIRCIEVDNCLHIHKMNVKDENVHDLLAKRIVINLVINVWDGCCQYTFLHMDLSTLSCCCVCFWHRIRCTMLGCMCYSVAWDMHNHKLLTGEALYHFLT